MSKLFMRKCVLETGNLKIDNSNLDITFSVPFDDDLEANIAEITVLNLTKETISSIKKGNKLSITAGYETDVGVISNAVITSVKTTKDGSNKVTTIKTRDGVNLGEKKVKKTTFAKNTKASKILKTLAKSTGMNIAKMVLPTDVTYTKGYTVEGELIEEMATVANHCGASVYINKNAIYIRSITAGDDTKFTLEVDTGLLDSPEHFTQEEEVSEEDLKYISKKRMTKKGSKYYIVTKGYKCKCLLRHKITVGSIVTLKASGINAKCRVKSGTHTLGSDFITELTMLEV